MPALDHLLQCPITQAPLSALNDAELATLNQHIQAGEIVFLSGDSVLKALEKAYTSADKRFYYMVQDGIICLLPNYALVRQEDAEEMSARYALTPTKQNVQAFYEQVGWKKGDQGLFLDTLKFEETRPVAKTYITKCHQRVERQLHAGGKYLLDVASGPLQFPEYLAYSKNFEKRICVDITFSALRSAQQQLGDKGIYILGDITKLPFQDNQIDAVISLHTIYHVPENEQKSAFQQIYRVLQPKGNAVIVYSWGSCSILMNLAMLPAKLIARGPQKAWKLWNAFFKGLRPKPLDALPEPKELILYYHPHNYAWFTQQAWPFQYRILSWRSINLDFLRAFIHEYCFGRWILDRIYALEEQFPAWFGRHGQYPLIVLSK